MRKGKLVFFGGFVLIALIAVTVYLIYGESTAGQAVVYSMFLVAGVWMLLRKRIIGGDKIKAATPSMRQPFGSSAVQMMQGQTVNAGDNVAKVRREKNFIVEENIDAIHWPAECAWCGGAVERCETIKMKNKFKEFGEVKAELKGIPYCQRCARNAKLTDRVNTAVIILALVIGIPLTIFAKMGPTSGGAETPWWLTFVVCAGIGYGIAWLLFKLPYKLFFKKNLAEPVSAWLNEELKSDGQQGVCVRIDIPNKKFADRFAELNITGASFTMPVQEISDQAVVRVTGAVQEKPLLTSTELLNLPGVRALIECTRDDIMDTKAYWKQALEDLQARGEEGSRALAALIAEMLNCRTEKITSALAMVKNLVPTRELKESLNAVISA